MSFHRRWSPHFDTRFVANIRLRFRARQRNELHAIVGAFGQPPAQVVLGEPASPANLEHLVEVELVHGKDNEKTGEPGETNQLVEKHCVVLVLQGIIKRVIPLIEKTLI